MKLPLSFTSERRRLEEEDLFFPVDRPLDERSLERVERRRFTAAGVRCGFAVVRIRHVGYPFLRRSHTTFSRATNYDTILITITIEY